MFRYYLSSPVGPRPIFQKTRRPGYTGIPSGWPRCRSKPRKRSASTGSSAIWIPCIFPKPSGVGFILPKTGPLAQPLPSPLETVEQVDALTFPDPQHSGRLPEILQTARLLAEYGRDRVPFIGLLEGPFTSTCRLFEADRIMRMLFRNRSVLNRLLDRVTEFLLLFAQALRDQGARLLLIPEPTASASMISPRLFDEWVLPRLRRIMSNIDLPCILHICGDTSSLWGSMAQTGARVLSLDQCMDLKTARAGIQELALGGNVDPVKSLLLGSTQTVKEDTWNCLRRAGTERFILMSGCSVPPGTPLENIRAMIEAAREYGLGQAEPSLRLVNPAEKSSQLGSTHLASERDPIVGQHIDIGLVPVKEGLRTPLRKPPGIVDPDYPGIDGIGKSGPLRYPAPGGLDRHAIPLGNSQFFSRFRVYPDHSFGMGLPQENRSAAPRNGEKRPPSQEVRTNGYSPAISGDPSGVSGSGR